jgi:hypothetical protein
MIEEFDCFKSAYPAMNFIEVKPKLVDHPSLIACHITWPTKKDYLMAVSEAIKQSKHSMYFGLYYSGSTMVDTGDWAVYDEN